MPCDFQFFVGIDWGSEKHRVCLLDPAGGLIEQRWFLHSGQSLAELADWLRRISADTPTSIAVAIEVPRGAIVETLLEAGFAVFAVNPKQLDRFRDRYSPAGAKDDTRDARVLADSLRTDRPCFLPLRLDAPELVRLRELSRLDDQLGEQFHRAANQLRQLWHRYFPQLLELCPAADEPWLWALFELAPEPTAAARLTVRKIATLLARHRIRRFEAAQVRALLRTPPLHLAPGAAEAIQEHALMMMPHLRLIHQQRTDLARRIGAVLQTLATPDDPQTNKHRDAAILLSLPGLGSKIAATMLCEAAQAIADRDYHALRAYAGAAPITRQSGKRKIVLMRRAINPRLRKALYHWSRVSVACDQASKKTYADMRARGHSHGRALRGMADRWLQVLCSMLRYGTLYDPLRRPN